MEGRGFRGGSDEKMRRMWLGLEIVVAGLPPIGLHRSVKPWMDETSLNKFCAFVSKVSFLAGIPVYWQFMYECVAVNCY